MFADEHCLRQPEKAKGEAEIQNVVQIKASSQPGLHKEVKSKGNQLADCFW